MDLTEIVIIAAMVWLVTLGFVVALCQSARQGDQLIVEDSVESVPARRFSTAA